MTKKVVIDLAEMRVPKHVAMDLIQYIKNIKVKAHFWDANSRSAYEIARQMSSPKLQKSNNSFECVLENSREPVDPKIMVEFLDGSKWEQDTAEFTCNEIRGMLFERARDAEDAVERAGGLPSPRKK